MRPLSQFIEVGVTLTCVLLLLTSCDDCRGQPQVSPTELEVFEVVDAGEPSEVHLVESSARTPYLPHHPELAIGAKTITLDGREVIEVVQGAVPDRVVNGGKTGFLIVPVQEALRGLSLPEEREARVLTISPDPRTPYRLVAQVLYTAGQSELLRYQFPVRDADGGKHAIFVTHDRTLPQEWLESGDAAPRGSGPDAGTRPRAPLTLMVTVTGEGFRLAATGEQLDGPDGGPDVLVPLATGWEASCPMLAVSERSGLDLGPPACAYDFEALRRRLEAIKRRHQDEREILLGAAADVDWETVVRTLDVTRGRPGAELFPDVTFVADFAP